MHPSSQRDHLASANRWEQGCRDDHIRNNLIVPELVALIERLRPATIVDLGAGTGYVARAVDEALTYRAKWTLIDNDLARLTVARENAANSMVVTYIKDDIRLLDDNKLNGDKFDLVLLCFTPLEFSSLQLLFGNARSLIDMNGWLALILPDPLQETTGSLQEMRRLMGGRVSLQKVDKFTGETYPFYISRNEDVISDALSNGFSLSSLFRIGEEKAFYVMVFSVNALQNL